MKAIAASSILLFSFSIVTACSNAPSTTDGGVDGASEAAPLGGCTTDVECQEVGQHCYFPINGGCSLQGNQGTCITYSQPATCTPNVACSCSGDTLSACAPDGYVDFPSRTSGACPDDGGPTSDASDADTSDADTDAADASPE